MQPYRMGELYLNRTAASKSFLNSDGTHTTEIHASPIHYVDANEDYRDISLVLVDEMDLHLVDTPVSKESAKRFEAVKAARINNKMADPTAYGYQGLKVPFDVRLSKKFNKGYTIGKGEETLIFRPLGASPVVGRPETASKIKYTNAWQDVDVTLELTNKGIKESIIINTPSAPTSFTFELGGAFGDLRKGELQIHPAWLVDANGTERDVLQQIRQVGARTYIDLTADTSGLVYPIVVDPTVTYVDKTDTLANCYTHTGTTTTTLSATTDKMYIGYSSGNFYNAFLKMKLPADLTGATVTSATLSIFNNAGYHSANSAMKFYTHINTSAWAEGGIAGNAMPTYSPPFNTSGTAPLTVVNLTDGQWVAQYYDIPVTTYVQQWASGTANNGFRFIPHDSTSYDYATFIGRTYVLTAQNITDGWGYSKLTITYNTAPTAPTVTYPNGGEVINASHTITWTAGTDAEAAQSALRYHIQLSTDGGTTYTDIVALTTAGATSYTYDFSAKPATTTARIRIRTYDGALYSGWDTSNANFTIQHSKLKVWTGTAWKVAKAKVWTGSAWKEAKVKVWTGSAWKEV